MKKAFPILGVLTAILLVYALYQALVVAPTEQTMGAVQRIFYYHVPSAWTAFLLFFINFRSSVYYLIKRCATADIVALVCAEVGVVFCTVVLITGPIWARPVWGIWWTWDIRLTSTLVLWLIYVSYLFLRRFSRRTDSVAGGGAGGFRSARCAVGLFFDLVFSHPASAAGDWRRRVDGSADAARSDDQLDGVSLFAFLVCWSRYRLEKLSREVDEAHAMQSLLDPGGRAL